MRNQTGRMDDTTPDNKTKGENCEAVERKAMKAESFVQSKHTLAMKEVLNGFVK